MLRHKTINLINNRQNLKLALIYLILSPMPMNGFAGTLRLENFSGKTLECRVNIKNKNQVYQKVISMSPSMDDDGWMDLGGGPVVIPTNSFAEGVINEYVVKTAEDFYRLEISCSDPVANRSYDAFPTYTSNFYYTYLVASTIAPDGYYFTPPTNEPGRTYLVEIMGAAAECGDEYLSLSYGIKSGSAFSFSKTTYKMKVTDIPQQR